MTCRLLFSNPIQGSPDHERDFPEMATPRCQHSS
jgi:hypothetical protein